MLEKGNISCISHLAYSAYLTLPDCAFVQGVQGMDLSKYMIQKISVWSLEHWKFLDDGWILLISIGI